jgi:hypothetical protein
MKQQGAPLGRLVVIFFLGWCTAVAAAASSALVLADSELTMRTTASVDLQVCAPGVLSEERAVVADAVTTTLRFLLMQTTAVYLVREYTTPTSGDMCLLYVYQAPSPAAAAYTEVLLSQQADVSEGQLSVTYTLATTSTTVRAICSLVVSQWQGEDAPLPLLPSVTADDLLFWGAIGGGVLAAAVVVACLCVVCALGCHRTRKRRRNHHPNHAHHVHHAHHTHHLPPEEEEPHHNHHPHSPHPAK